MKETVFICLLVSMLVFGFTGCDNGSGSGSDINEFTVTFDTDGGSIAPNSVKVEDGKSIENLPKAPTKGFWVFDGWYTKKKGAGTEFKSDTIVTGDIIVFAKWISIFEGTWNETSSTVQVIFTGETYIVKMDSKNLKKCSFTYTGTTMTETVMDNFGNDGINIGDEVTVEYTLDDNVLTVSTMGQIFNKDVYVQNPYAGIWENDEYKVRMVLANDLSFEFFDNKIIEGNWEKFAKGYLEINNTNVTFNITHKWLSAESAWTDDQDILDSIKYYFGGSLTLIGTVNGSATGSIMDFSPVGEAMIKK